MRFSYSQSRSLTQNAQVQFSSYSVLGGFDGDFIPILRLNLPSNESLLLIFDPAGALDVVRFVHSIQALLL